MISESIVSVEWLKEHLNNDKLILLNATIPKVVGKLSELAQVQIPHSQFFDIKNKFSNVSAKFPNTIPSETQFEKEARLLGVNNDSIVIIYDDLGMYSSPRAWWMFKTFGFKNVAVLNGGLPEWQTKGFIIEDKKENSVALGNFTASYNPENIVFFDDIEDISKSEHYKIIDARSSNRFNCKVPEPRKGLQSGNILNSVNLPYQTILNKNTLKPTSELKPIFKNIANNNQELVFTCGSGITASILALGATICGYKNSVYDGSWTEYGNLTKI